jgi:hypothetical protein
MKIRLTRLIFDRLVCQAPAKEKDGWATKRDACPAIPNNMDQAGEDRPAGEWNRDAPEHFPF